MSASFRYPADTVMGELERLRSDVNKILALIENDIVMRETRKR